jgi:hypothetical protein
MWQGTLSGKAGVTFSGEKESRATRAQPCTQRQADAHASLRAALLAFPLLPLPTSWLSRHMLHCARQEQNCHSYPRFFGARHGRSVADLVLTVTASGVSLADDDCGEAMGERGYEGLKDQVSDLENIISNQAWEIQKLQYPEYYGYYKGQTSPQLAARQQTQQRLANLPAKGAKPQRRDIVV